LVISPTRFFPLLLLRRTALTRDEDDDDDGDGGGGDALPYLGRAEQGHKGPFVVIRKCRQIDREEKRRGRVRNSVEGV